MVAILRRWTPSARNSPMRKCAFSSRTLPDRISSPMRMMPAVDMAGATVVPKCLVSERSSELIEKRELLDSAGIVRALKRMAHEIVERNIGAGDIVLVGIRTAGVPLAERLAGFVRDTGELEASTGAIDITLYRDDVFEGLP